MSAVRKGRSEARRHEIPSEPNSPRPAIVADRTNHAGSQRCSSGSARRSAGPLSGPRDLARIAVEGEAIGYDYCTISDHVVIPRDIEAKYPYSDTGEFPGRAGGDRHEQLTAVAFVAGKTSKLRLVTSVTVVPHRPPVLTAKMLATIDVLSEGRLHLGHRRRLVQGGVRGDRHRAVRGARRRHRRDIAACRELWTNENPQLHRQIRQVLPTSSSQPRRCRSASPIWVGGESGPALRRTARLGDAWYPIGTNPRTGSIRWSGFNAGVERLRRLTREAGRDPARSRSPIASPVRQGMPDAADNGERRLFSGDNRRRSSAICGRSAISASRQSISASPATPLRR